MRCSAGVSDGWASFELDSSEWCSAGAVCVFSTDAVLG